MAVRSIESNLLDQYFLDISDSTPLDSASECGLARRIQQGDQEARNELIQANLRFVVRLASEFQGCGMDLQDLISAGNVGLITAAERFDPERGVKFITYALWWIRQAILNSLSQDTRTVRLPANRVKLLNSIAQISREFQQKAGIEPLANQIDVLLIDLGIPGMSGDQISRHIRNDNPLVATVLMTGWNLAENDSRAEPFDLRIQKPFESMAGLIKIVDRAIQLRDGRTV